MKEAQLNIEVLQKIREDIQAIVNGSAASDWKVISAREQTTSYEVYMVCKNAMPVKEGSLRIEARVSFKLDGTYNALKCPGLFVGIRSWDDTKVDKLYLDVRRIFWQSNDPLLDFTEKLYSIARLKIAQFLANKYSKAPCSEGQLRAEKELFDIYGALCSTSNTVLVD